MPEGSWSTGTCCRKCPKPAPTTTPCSEPHVTGNFATATASRSKRLAPTHIFYGWQHHSAITARSCSPTHRRSSEPGTFIRCEAGQGGVTPGCGAAYPFRTRVPLPSSSAGTPRGFPCSARLLVLVIGATGRTAHGCARPWVVVMFIAVMGVGPRAVEATLADVFIHRPRVEGKEPSQLGSGPSLVPFPPVPA